MEFYSGQLREKIAVPETDIAITTAENGRRQARAPVQRDGKAIKLFTFLPNEATSPAGPMAAPRATKRTKGSEETATATTKAPKKAAKKTST